MLYFDALPLAHVTTPLSRCLRHYWRERRGFALPLAAVHIPGYMLPRQLRNTTRALRLPRRKHYAATLAFITSPRHVDAARFDVARLRFFIAFATLMFRYALMLRRYFAHITTYCAARCALIALVRTPNGHHQHAPAIR